MCPTEAICLPADLFQWASTIKIQLSVLVYYKVDLIIISLKINLFSPWYIVYIWKIVELALNNNQSIQFQCSVLQNDHPYGFLVDHQIRFYTPHNEVVGGYTGFTMSVCPSVCRQILCRTITWVVFLRIF
jgi:hypothetical protein